MKKAGNRPRLWSCFLIFGLATTAFAQISADEAMKRLREKEAARRGATDPQPVVPNAIKPGVGVGAWQKYLVTDPGSLKADRKDFKTELKSPGAARKAAKGVDQPPAKVFKVVKYTSDVGPLWAYITPDPNDRKKHPAVIWLHGGFDTIGGYLFDKASPANDQSPRAFLEAGLVVMCPGVRGRGDNPGQFELFYGEVNDVLAAIEYAAALPYVDADHIYVVGHSTGGTLALLVAEASSRPRAVVSLGGMTNARNTFDEEELASHTPFDINKQPEWNVRSAEQHIGALKTPTWYFEASGTLNGILGFQMGAQALHAKVPLHTVILSGATHFDIIRPATKLMAAKFLADSGPKCSIDVKAEELATSFGEIFPDKQKKVRTFEPLEFQIEITARAKAAHDEEMKKATFQKESQGLQFHLQEKEVKPFGHFDLVRTEALSEGMQLSIVDGIRVVVNDRLARAMGPSVVIDFPADGPDANTFVMRKK